ncbi:FecR family protein [Flexithrix dorotheae]|uniref:FecR family protein n=1 Tax=Flexithrix dorotheae TaxID=70993 RepID=UPI0003800B2A|nr:FecR family protein [Flexithrix dorotheae]
MDKKEISNLYEKYLRGDCTLKEEKLLEDFLESFQHQKIKFEEENEEYKNNRGLRILNNIKFEIQDREYKSVWKRRVLKYAAMLTILLVSGWIIYQTNLPQPENKKAEIAYITKSTQKGQRLELVLGDGTSIKINSESELTFPEKFIGNKREVFLKGEAFFEVKRDEKRPFIIRTENVTTRVLGTSFNINSYPGENEIQVAVVSGKVQVVSDENRKTDAVILTAEEMATYHKGKKDITKSRHDSDLTAWRDGILLIKGENFTEIIAILERWYGVEFQLKKPVVLESEFYGRYNNENLDNILKTLSYAGGFKYKLKNKRVIIY